MLYTLILEVCRLQSQHFGVQARANCQAGIKEAQRAKKKSSGRGGASAGIGESSRLAIQETGVLHSHLICLQAVAVCDINMASAAAFFSLMLQQLQRVSQQTSSCNDMWMLLELVPCLWADTCAVWVTSALQTCNYSAYALGMNVPA